MELDQKKLILQNKTIAALLVIMSFPFQLLANDSIGDIDDLQAQRVLYEAKAAVKTAKIAAGEDVDATISVGSKTGDKEANQSALPRLSKISGDKAFMILSNGDSITVTNGTLLPGSRWQVVAVGLSGVTLNDIATSKKIVIN